MIVNANSVILGLKDIVNCPVAPDEYIGDKNKYICFVYADEVGVEWADNVEQAVRADIQITLYCPSTYNYMSDKKKIKNYLVQNGFDVTSISSFLEVLADGSRQRHLVFTTGYYNFEED